MKVTIVTPSEKTAEEREYRESLVIRVNGKQVFQAVDGELEDNSLLRNFSNCYDIPNLMRMAYEAGKLGEPFEIQEVTDDG